MCDNPSVPENQLATSVRLPRGRPALRDDGVVDEQHTVASARGADRLRRLRRRQLRVNTAA